MSTNSPPRAYKFPYTNDLYEKVVIANAKLNKNIALLGEIEDDDQSGKIQVEDASRLGQISKAMQFYDLPDPLIPDK